jgi:WD40 repeat protein/serine/threonine protein kinase
MTISHLPYQSATSNEDSDDAILARVVAEIGELMAQGVAIDQDVYVKRYPEFADRLRSLWPALRATAERDVTDQPGWRTGELVRADHCELSEQPSRTLGDFVLIREIGRGGKGIVYEAEQTSLRRTVALKVLTAAGSIDERQLQRFQIEARAAAALHHPNIIPVFGVGTERRVPFYAMQFIDGISLAAVIGEMRQLKGLESGGPTTACALTRSLLAGHFAPTPEQGLPSDFIGSQLNPTSSCPPSLTPESARSRGPGRGFMRTVAELGIQAASALEHAHGHGILHRDIKPSNLLVDEAGHLWVTDFGLARMQGESDLTQTGDVLGTLRYLCPESAAGGGKRVFLDGRTDIYSLGVTLYELLTLRPAFFGDDRVEILRRIAQDMPTPPRKLDPTIPIDLETIVLKAMAKAPPDRYATAAELAADLGRFLENRPIHARRPSFADRGAKWIRRHRALVANLATAVGLIGVALALAGWRYTSLLRRHNVALQTAVAKAEEQAKEATRQRRIADRHAFASTLRLAGQAVLSRQFETAQDLLDSIRTNSDGEDSRGFAWYFLHRLARRELVRLPEQDDVTFTVSMSHDGRTIASSHPESSIVLWDVPSESPRLRIEEPGVRYGATCLTSDGRLLIACGLPQTPESLHDLGIWDTTTGELRAVLHAHPFPPGTFVGYDRTIFSLDSERLVAHAWIPDKGRTSIRIWALDLDRKKHRPLVALDGLDAVAFAPAGPYFATLDGSQLAVRDVSSGAVVRQSHSEPGGIGSLALSRDGRMLATATPNQGIIVRDTDDWEHQSRYDVGAPIIRLSFDPLGTALAAVDDEYAVRICDRPSGRIRRLTPDDVTDGRRENVQLCFSDDGARLAAQSERTVGGRQPTVVWDVASGRRLATMPSRSPGFGLFAPDGRSFITATTIGRAPRIWYFDPAHEPPSPAGHKDEAWAAAYSPDGKILATGSDDTDEPQTIKLWDPATGQLVRGWNGGVGTVASLAFSPDGRWLASGHLTLRDNVRIWDVVDGHLLRTLSGRNDRVRSVAFAPDGRTLASAGGYEHQPGEDWAIHVWDVAAGTCLRQLEGHSDIVHSLAFSPDGRSLATASPDKSIRMWDAETGRLVRIARDPMQFVAVAFAPDGRTLAAATGPGVVTIRDAITLETMNTIRHENNETLRGLAFAPDGQSVATCGMSGKIRLWDTLTGQELLTLEGHKAQVNGIAFAPDGSSLASCSHDGQVKLWRARETQTR